jgi:hypothetical protein
MLLKLFDRTIQFIDIESESKPYDEGDDEYDIDGMLFEE